jgi:hypothetical protein
VGKPGTKLIHLSTAVAAMLVAAGPSGFLVPNAAAQVARRPDDESSHTDTPLLVVPSDEAASYLAHRSHSSHSSHRSHSSGGGGGGGGGYDPAPAPAPSPPPKPASVSFLAYPGGRIFVDGQLVGHDSTGTLTLKPGSHAVRVENRLLGIENRIVDLIEGQIGIIEIDW